MYKRFLLLNELVQDSCSELSCAPCSQSLIANWVGTETDTVWTHITPYDWEITREPGDGAYAKLIMTRNPTNLKYLLNIYRHAQAIPSI